MEKDYQIISKDEVEEWNLQCVTTKCRSLFYFSSTVKTYEKIKLKISRRKESEFSSFNNSWFHFTTKNIIINLSMNTDLFFKCWVLPRHLNCPSAMIVTLEHNDSHSLILCEVKTTARPLATQFFILDHRNLLPFGSIPLVGSS